MEVTVDEYASIGQVLQEAMEEICCLEEKNSKMQDALTNLHEDLLGVNRSMTSSSLSAPISNNADCDALVKLRAENKLLLDQLNGFKKASSEFSVKLGLNVSSSEEGKLEDSVTNLVELKKRLSTSSIMCQQLANKNNGNVTKRKSMPLLTKNTALHGSSNSVLDESNADEIQRRLFDALEKNNRWQTYNGEREHYVSTLLTKYNQISTELQNVRKSLAEIKSNPDKLAVEQRRYFDNLLVNARQELENQRSKGLRDNTELQILKDKNKDEVSRMEKDMERWRKRYEEQREALAALNANYEHERRRSNNSLVESKEKQSQIHLLQRQVQLFSEDFRAERKEKELLQNEATFLREKVNQLEKQTNGMDKKPRMLFTDMIHDEQINSTSNCIDPDVHYNDLHRAVTRRKPPSPTKRVTKRPQTPVTDVTSERSHKSNVPSRRPVPTVSNKSHTTKERNPALKNQSSKSTRSHATKVTNSTKHAADLSVKKTSKQLCNTDSTLQCPGCGKTYNIDEHVLLLEHIDVCGD